MIVDLSGLTDGFSSRLRVISFFLAIIKIQKLKKELFIYEKKKRECPILFLYFFKLKGFKLFKLRKKPKNSIRFNSYNLDALKMLKKNYDIKIYNDQDFILLSNLFYKNFIPNTKVQRMIAKLKLPKKFIGIHIRTTDRMLNMKNFLSKIQFPEMIFDFQISRIIKNLINFVNSITKINNVFISSDDKYYKELTLKSFNKNFHIFSNNTLYKKNNFRQTNGKDFVTELFCLSKSRIIISTVGGAVPNAASLISKKKIKIYKLTNIFNFYIFFKIVVLIIFYVKRLKSLLFNLIKQ